MPTRKDDELFASEMSDMVETCAIKMSKSTLDVAIQWMQSNLEPEDIFSEKQLSNWAETNGYIKK